MRRLLVLALVLTPMLAWGDWWSAKKRRVAGPTSLTGFALTKAPDLTKLYAHWSMDELGGTRAKTAGVATSADLSEVGGAVAYQTSNCHKGAACAYQTIAGTNYLSNTTLNPTLDFSTTGYTVTCWFTVKDPNATAGLQLLVRLRDGPGDVQINILHGYASGEEFFQASTIFGAGKSAVFPGPPYVSGPLAYINKWHFVALWYDPTPDTLSVQFDNGPVTSMAIDPSWNTFLTGIDRIDVASTGTAARYWDGAVDDLRVWKYPLSDAEREYLRQE